MGNKIMEEGLDRINKSVYLGSISKSSLKSLEQWLTNELTQKGEPQDSLIIMYVSAQQIQTMRIYGSNDLDKDELSGDKSTLIL